MGKRLFLAATLSFLVLLIWSSFISKTQLIENKDVMAQRPLAKDATTVVPSHNKDASLVSGGDLQEPAPSLLTFKQEKFEVTFNESQAALKEVVFTEYKNHKFVLGSGLVLADKPLFFKKEDSAANEVRFVHTDAQKRVIKKFIFSNSNYNIELEILWQNLSSSPIVVQLPFIVGTLDFSGAKDQARYQDIMVATPGKTLNLNGQRDADWPEFKFMGLRDRYFCVIIQPDTDKHSGFIKKINPRQSQLGFRLPEQTVAPGEQIGHKFRIYLGPQQIQWINKADPAWSLIMHYGTFNLISQLLVQLLDFLYRQVHNWGLAIILLSLIIYLLLYPLSVKQMRSMKEMNALKPHIDELRKLYKDSPQKLNKEIMELYRQHKINPLGGCLPMILQLPIFFALYQALMRSVALKGAHFLWVKDLSEPDRLFMLPTSLPILGNEVNILPIVMAILMLIQQKFSMATTSGGSAEQEKMMLVIFPLMFGLIFYRMPSGLVLYWLVNSALMIFFQLRMARKR